MHAKLTKRVLHETWFFFILNRHLTCTLHASYMQITCPVQHMLARREHLKYSIHFGPLGLNIYAPTASPTILKCFTSCNCSMHVLLHVTSILGVMLHDVTCIENVSNPCRLQAACMYNVLPDMHVTWLHVVTSKVYATCMQHAQLFEWGWKWLLNIVCNRCSVFALLSKSLDNDIWAQTCMWTNWQM